MCLINYSNENNLIKTDLTSSNFKHYSGPSPAIESFSTSAAHESTYPPDIVELKRFKPKLKQGSIPSIFENFQSKYMLSIKNYVKIIIIATNLKYDKC